MFYVALASSETLSEKKATAGVIQQWNIRFLYKCICKQVSLGRVLFDDANVFHKLKIISRKIPIGGFHITSSKI